jgi:type II secretory pathway pseudopilin PulG
MAALLVSLSIMSIMLTVAMPVWKQLATREKEAELVFRGEQYARAIGLFQRKAGPGVLPPTVDVLVQQKFLRKAYKDPITGEDFALIRQGQQPAVGPGASTPGSSRPGMNPTPDPQSPAGAGGAGRGRGSSPIGGQVTNTFGGSSAFGQVINTPGGAVGGIQGVTSKSTAASIRQYNGRTRYNQWEFVYVQQAQAPGAGAPPGTQAPGQGQRGGPPGLPGGPGGFGRGGFGRGGPAGRGGPTGAPFSPLTPQPPPGGDQRPFGAPPPPPQ